MAIRAESAKRSCATSKSSMAISICSSAVRTQNAIESQMMLSERGAEALLEHGDLFFRDVGKPMRLQAPLTNADERRAIFHP